MRNECINLPLSAYTKWYWQMDLKNMFHFLMLRRDRHAQREVQEDGRAMAKVGFSKAKRHPARCRSLFH